LRSDSTYLYAQWTDGRNANYNDLYFSKALLSELGTGESLPKNTETHPLLCVPTIWHGEVTMRIMASHKRVNIKAYDIAGRLVCTLFAGKVLKTTTKTINSSYLPYGILFIKATALFHSETKKVIHLGG